MITYTIEEGSSYSCIPSRYYRTSSVTNAFVPCDRIATATNETLEYYDTLNNCIFSSKVIVRYADNGPLRCEGYSFNRCNRFEYSLSTMFDIKNGATSVFIQDRPCADGGPCPQTISLRAEFNTPVYTNIDLATTKNLLSTIQQPTTANGQVPIVYSSFFQVGTNLSSTRIYTTTKTMVQSTIETTYNKIVETAIKYRLKQFKGWSGPYTTQEGYQDVGGYPGIGGYPCRIKYVVKEGGVNIPDTAVNFQRIYNTVAILTNYYGYWIKTNKEIFGNVKYIPDFLKFAQKGFYGYDVDTKFTIPYGSPAFTEYRLNFGTRTCLPVGTPDIITFQNGAIINDVVPPLKVENKTITTKFVDVVETFTSNLDYEEYRTEEPFFSVNGFHRISTTSTTSTYELFFNSVDTLNPGVPHYVKNIFSTSASTNFNFENNIKFDILYSVPTVKSVKIPLDIYVSNCKSKNTFIEQKVAFRTSFIRYVIDSIDTHHLRGVGFDIYNYGRAMIPNEPSSYYTNIRLNIPSTFELQIGGYGQNIISFLPNLTIPIGQLLPTFVINSKTVSVNISSLNLVKILYKTTNNEKQSTITSKQFTWKGEGAQDTSTYLVLLYNDNLVGGKFYEREYKNIGGICNVGNTKSSITNIYFPGTYLSFNNSEINILKTLSNLITRSSINKNNGFLLESRTAFIRCAGSDYSNYSAVDVFSESPVVLPFMLEAINGEYNSVINQNFYTTYGPPGNIPTIWNLCYQF